MFDSGSEELSDPLPTDRELDERNDEGIDQDMDDISSGQVSNERTIRETQQMHVSTES